MVDLLNTINVSLGIIFAPYLLVERLLYYIMNDHSSVAIYALLQLIPDTRMLNDRLNLKQLVIEWFIF